MRLPVQRRRHPIQRRRLAAPCASSAGESGDVIHERSVAFHEGDLFYRPASRLIRDLGVLALAVLQQGRSDGHQITVLDSMSGTGVRSLRYASEVAGSPFVHANERMYGEHPLRQNLAALVDEGRCKVTDEDAIDLYMRARLEGKRFDLVDADGFGTGQPHIAEAWWAVAKGGLFYACATDSCTTAGHNPHKAMSGYAGVAHYYPSCNEQGLRLLVGAAWREAAARNLEVKPVFSFFHRPSSSLRVMLRLVKPKRPPAHAYESLSYVGRCGACGQLWRVPPTELGSASSLECSSCASHDSPSSVTISGMMWTGPMHDAEYVGRMAEEARQREWEDAAELLDRMTEEARAEERGALLYYHLGEVQRMLASRGLGLPPLAKLIDLIEAGGFSASHSHIERKAIKTSATLEQMANLVLEAEAAAALPLEAKESTP